MGTAAIQLQDIERMYAELGALVLHRCRRFLRAESAAWDAMHQTFLRAIQYRTSYRGGSEVGWLYSIATRVCLDELKRAAGPALAVDFLDELEGERVDLEDDVDRARMLAWVLARFGDGVRQIVALRYFDELEVAEIATRTNSSERTVARRLAKFHTRARKLLENRT